jgi:hypothetical protein
VARYFAANFVAAHQQVGSFEVVNQFGNLQKNGGNVASYFCTPDGQVVHALTGPAKAEELLAEARWAIALEKSCQGPNTKSVPDTFLGAHRDAMESLQQRGRLGAPYQIHRLLARKELPALKDVYRDIFQNILGQPLSQPETELDHAERAFAAAGRSKLPILLILHRGSDNQAVLHEWQRTVAGQSQTMATTFDSLTRCYVVVALRVSELAAFSRRLGVSPYAAPDQGSPLFVIARSNARQLSAVTTWDKSDDLAYALGQGIVQEAKEHARSSLQLRSVLAAVEPLDAGLSNQVRKLLAESVRRATRPGTTANIGG